MTLDSRKFLPPEAVARVSRLEVLARNVVEGFLNGMHRSPYYGQSVEFAQHREYVSGDDLRRIDWKAWSKTDRYYVKQYEEETNLRTTLVVDLSESMMFGSGEKTKSEFATQISAVLSLLLLKQHDAVSLVTFDDQIRTQIPMSSKKTQLHDILIGLSNSKPARKTNLGTILSQVADQESRKGLIILISDLLSDQDELLKGLRLLRFRGHDVMLFHVLDDAELDFPFNGPTKFEGLEETGELVCDPRSLREGYLAAMQSFLDQIRKYCAKFVIDHQIVRTSENLDAVLLHYMNHRIGMHQSQRA